MTESQGSELATREQQDQALSSRGIEREQWRVLRESIWPSAESPASVLMAWDYCKARGLDPFKRPVHIVPMYSSRHKRMIETVWPGISELRTTASRTGEYVGCSAPEWGPMEEREFTWQEKKSGPEITKVIRFPSYCRVTVKRRHTSGVISEYTAEVYWEETYASVSKFHDAPNAMWRKRTRGQLAKCAEAAALRMAFPEEVGNELSAEEMDGQMLDITDTVLNEPVETAPPAPTREQFEEPEAEILPPEGTAHEEPAPQQHDNDPIDDPVDNAVDAYIAAVHAKLETFTESKAMWDWWEGGAEERDQIGLTDSHIMGLEQAITNRAEVIDMPMESA